VTYTRKRNPFSDTQHYWMKCCHASHWH
jgi:hypothetical protein